MIDLRVDDEMMSNGRWRRIIKIEVDTESWLNDEMVMARTDTDGFCYRLTDETRRAEELRMAKSQR